MKLTSENYNREWSVYAGWMKYSHVLLMYMRDVVQRAIIAGRFVYRNVMWSPVYSVIWESELLGIDFTCEFIVKFVFSKLL